MGGNKLWSSLKWQEVPALVAILMAGTGLALAQEEAEGAQPSSSAR